MENIIEYDFIIININIIINILKITEYIKAVINFKKFINLVYERVKNDDGDIKK